MHGLSLSPHHFHPKQAIELAFFQGRNLAYGASNQQRFVRACTRAWSRGAVICRCNFYPAYPGTGEASGFLTLTDCHTTLQSSRSTNGNLFLAWSSLMPVRSCHLLFCDRKSYPGKSPRHESCCHVDHACSRYPVPVQFHPRQY